MYVNLADHLECLLHFAGFNQNWIMTKLMDLPCNTFSKNLLNVRKRDKWKGTLTERERNGEVLRRIFARFQCERGKNSPFNGGDDDIKNAGVIQVLICWRSQSF
jgi:hypothetical protein